MSSTIDREEGGAAVYLKQDFDIQPASPATRDRFVELAISAIGPALDRLGARLVGAWFNHAEWYSQLTHVLEFSNLAAFGAFRLRARADGEWRDIEAKIEALAPARHEALLETLGPVPASALHDAIAEARDKPAESHSLAILEVAPGQMERFAALLAFAKDGLPIVASWRPVAGNPNLVIDLWKGEIGREAYRPSSERLNAFFGPLREVAPRERLVHLHPLPYSPLR